jgi:integrase
MSGYREGENPAAWRGRLDKVLPPRKRVQKTRHHPALPYAEIGKFMSKVREQDAIAAAALEFLILTATRTSEVIGAKWEEIAFVESTWTIPAERMKAGREHRVPLSESALALLRRMSRLTNNAESSGYVFPGGRAGKALSNMALSQVLKRMGYAEITVHGFRSTFRDWAAEQTAFARDVCEQALAHSLPDKVEAAYRRSDLFEKRRKLMESWATFCADIRSNGEVLPMRTVSGVSRGKG